MGASETIANKQEVEENSQISSSHGLKNIYREMILLVAAFIVIFVSYIVFKPLNKINGTADGFVAKLYCGICIAIVFCYLGVMAYLKKLTFERKMFVVILIAFFVHLMYMLYTPYNCRQQDMSYDGKDGHYSYAISFYETFRLPTECITESTVYQFYHPPLNAFLQGMFMHVFEGINTVSSLEENEHILYQSTQILACFYMFVTSVYFIKTLNRSRLSNGSKMIGMVFAALFPRLTQLSGQLNNDGLAIMFCSIAIYFFAKWYFEKKSYTNILLTGLFIGLAMFSKMSSVNICIGIGIAFVIEFIRSLKKKEGSLPIKTIVIQYVLFLCVCAPLGLWFQFYTHYVYGLPFNFVFKNLNSALYTGTRGWVLKNNSGAIDYYDRDSSALLSYTSVAYNILIRYISPIWIPDFVAGGTYCSAFSNYNILSYALRSSMFGEFSYWNTDVLAVVVTVFIYMLWVSLIVFLIYALITKKKMGRDGAFYLYLTGGIILMYLYLQVKMPYGCSMDFRYIVPIVLPIGYLLGKENDILSAKEHTKFMKVYKYINISLVYSFIGLTCLFYLFAI